MTMRIFMPAWLPALIIVIAGGVLLASCRTSISLPNDYASRAIGSPIENLLVAIDRDHARDPKKEPSREDLMKMRYVTSNGNVIYVDPANFRRCNIHWEVNPAGIIVGYRFEEVVKGGCDW